MQVKKFEAPTLQEALETIKRELGPEAIILQTKQNRRGFGLMSKGSVEVTAAVSQRAVKKKEVLEKRLPEAYSKNVTKLPAEKQADIYDKYLESKIAENSREKIQLSAQAKSKKMTAVRYADIDDDGSESPANQPAAETTLVRAPEVVAQNIETYNTAQMQGKLAIEEEIANLKRLVEELRRDKLAQSFVDPSAPYMVTESLQNAFETLIHAGVERRFAVQFMREAAMQLNAAARADQDQVLDQVAQTMVEGIEVVPFFPEEQKTPRHASIVAFIGLSGVGKTSILGKLATHAVRGRNERVALIRIQDNKADDPVDALGVLAKALHVPYRVVQGSESLLLALDDLNNFDWIFIDTPAMGIRDRNQQSRMQAILQSDPRIRTELVISAATREIELAEISKVFSKFRPESLFFTKLDESLAYGGMISIAQRMKLPISIFATGRKVTEDWENATAERIVAEVLDI